MDPQIITVTEFVGIINETLGFAYPQVIIEGELSSFKVNQGKFVFFDLKDDQNVLNCFMMIHQLKLPLEDGMKVRVTATPKVTKFSKFSLTVRSVEIAGEGALKRAMELLKQKLTAEGLFAAERKRALPPFPTRLGLITSGTSAAYSDFIKIINARWGGVHIVLADVSVQGNAAPDQIIGALEYFNQLAEPVDVVVLIRGGGSLEDLMAFSTEPVARAVAASRTPIIVGVGHEVDVSLADYAADVRAATPTDAARLVVPDRAELAARIDHGRQRLISSIGQTVTGQTRLVERNVSALERYLRRPQERIASLTNALWRNFERVQGARSRTEIHVGSLEQRFTVAQAQRTSEYRQRITSLGRIMKGFDPEAALQRGYAIVRSDDTIIRDPASVQSGSKLVIQLAKGRLEAEARRTS